MIEKLRICFMTWGALEPAQYTDIFGCVRVPSNRRYEARETVIPRNPHATTQHAREQARQRAGCGGSIAQAVAEQRTRAQASAAVGV